MKTLSRTFNTTTQANRRLAVYFAMTAFAIIGAVMLSGTQWQTSAYTHTTVEAAATLLAALIGIIAVTRYCARRNGAVLLIAGGFLGTAAINCYHTAITSEAFIARLQSNVGDLMAISDMAVQQFFAIVLLASAMARPAAQAKAASLHMRFWLPRAAVMLLVVCAFASTYLFDLPSFQLFGVVITNPVELVAGCCLAAAFLASLIKGDWRHDAFDHWVMIAIIIACASDMLFMSRSSWMFDFEFNIAHALKIVSYLCIFAGLMMSLFHTLRGEEQRADQLDEAKNEAEHALAEIACHKLALDQHAIVMVLNLQGRISDGNDQFCHLTGYTRKELAGPSGDGLAASTIFITSFDDLWWTVCSGDTWKGEIEIRSKDDSRFHLSTTVVPFRNERGHITYFMVVQTDVTDHREAEYELAGHAAHTALLNDISVAANQSDDVEAAARYCLERICRFTGWSFGQVLLRDENGTADFSAPGWWHSKEPDRHQTFIRQTDEIEWKFGMGLPGHVFAGGKPRYWNDTDHVEWWHRVSAFQECNFRGGAAFPVNVKGKVVAILEFWAPFTIEASSHLKEILAHTVSQLGQVFERTRSEQELLAHRDHLQELVDAATANLKEKASELRQALDKEKELNVLQRQFVSMASHEFRTPLAIIDSAAQRMKSRIKRDRLTPEDASLRIEKIRAAVQRMTRLMESTLSAARLQEGKIKIEIAPCNVAQVVRETCERNQEIAHNHLISCRIGTLPETIQADAGALEQILTNLLSNALKYAPDAPSISVNADSDGDDVRIAVQDYGLGIDADELERIGERFFRAKTSTGIEGTGIGLNLIKTLVEMHDGTIMVESTKGKGSTFVVRLPVCGPATSTTSQVDAA